MSYLFADEGAGQSHNWPEENAAAQDDLSVEAVAQVTEDGSCHHEAADEDCGRKRGQEKCYLTTLTRRLCLYSTSLLQHAEQSIKAFSFTHEAKKPVQNDWMTSIWRKPCEGLPEDVSTPTNPQAITFPL